MLEIKELGYNQFSNDELKFPTIIKDMEILAYKFVDYPARNDVYEFIVYEYYKNKPQKKHVQRGRWSKGQIFSFDMKSDYYFEHGKKYAIKILIHLANKGDVYDIVFIDLEMKYDNI